MIVAVKTDPSERHRGVSLLVARARHGGFERGRNLEKIGQHAQDTAELFFNDVHVPAANLLGEEGQGFRYLVSNLAQERLSIAIGALGAARAGLAATLEYMRERTAFGQPVSSFQNSRSSSPSATPRSRSRRPSRCCVEALGDGALSPEDAAIAKFWCTEVQGRVLDRCVQLHGGYGYMTEYAIARAWADARATRIFGGTNEIMREIIGRSLERGPRQEDRMSYDGRWQTIRVAVDDGIAWLELHRPEKRNAMNPLLNPRWSRRSRRSTLTTASASSC